MGVATLLFSRVKMKKRKSLTSHQEIVCCGIKDWDILERRVFNNYKVKVWIKVFLIVIKISIFVNIIYMGRRIKLNFLSSATRENEILDLMHNDVFGPIHAPSLGGSMYYVIFIDDFSRNTWLYFLRKKLKVFIKFEEIKDLVENQIGK